MASGPGTTATTAALSPCSAAAALRYLALRIFSAHIIHAPSSHRRPESQFLPLPWFSLHSFFSSPLHPLTIPALPQDQLSARFCFFLVVFPLQARSHPSRSFRSLYLQSTNAFADFCRFEACSLSPFHRDTRHSFTQLLVSSSANLLLLEVTRLSCRYPLIAIARLRFNTSTSSVAGPFYQLRGLDNS